MIDPQSLNKYQYCYNNPLTTVDPDGHKGWKERLGEAARDFGDGLIRGAAASAAGALGLGTPPGAGPSSDDSWVNIGGQIVGTAIIGGIGTQTTITGVSVTLATWETGGGAVVGAGVTAIGLTSVYGAAKNSGAILMAAKNKIDNESVQSGGGAQQGGGNTTGKKPVVFGENMKERVIPYAKKNGADHYKPRNWSMSNNKRWAKRLKKESREVIDIGPDPNRRRRSEAYKMESDEFKDYPRLRKEHQ